MQTSGDATLVEIELVALPLPAGTQPSPRPGRSRKEIAEEILRGIDEDEHGTSESATGAK